MTTKKIDELPASQLTTQEAMAAFLPISGIGNEAGELQKINFADLKSMMRDDRTVVPHPYWRVFFDASGSNAFCGLSDLQFFEANSNTDAVTLYPGTPIASSGSPILAFDADMTTGWNAAGASGVWVGYHFGKDVGIARISIGAAQVAEQSPKDFRIQFSDDGASWTDAFVVTGQTAWLSSEMRQFSDPNPTWIAVSGGPAPTLRGVAVATSNGASIDVALPSGSVVGDYAVFYYAGGNSVALPTGWQYGTIANGNGWNAALFTKVLTASDITAGKVTGVYNGSYWNSAALMVFVGNTYARKPYLLTTHLPVGPFGIELTDFNSNDYIIAAVTNRASAYSTLDGGNLLSQTGAGEASVSIYSFPSVDGAKRFTGTIANNGGYDTGIVILGVGSGRGYITTGGNDAGTADYPDFAGNKHKFLSVNEDETGVEWIDPNADTATIIPVLRGANYSKSYNSTATIGFPTGTAEGDFALLFTGGGWNSSPPASWTTIGSYPGDAVAGSAYYKVLTASDIAVGSVTVNFLGNYEYTASLSIYQGGTITGVGDFKAVRDSNAVSPYTLPAITTPESSLSVVFSWVRNSATVTIAPGTMVSAGDGAGNSNSFGLATMYATDSTRQFTITNSSAGAHFGMAVSLLGQTGKSNVEEAPTDSKIYGRSNKDWVEIVSGSNTAVSGSSGNRIERINLAGLNTYTFTNIPQDGDGIELLMTGNSDTAVGINVFVNNDHTQMYDIQRFYSNAANQGQNVTGDQFLGHDRFDTLVSTGNATMGSSLISLSFDNHNDHTLAKTMLGGGRQPSSDASAYLLTFTGDIRTANPITSLTVELQGGAKFIAGSVATLLKKGGTQRDLTPNGSIFPSDPNVGERYFHVTRGVEYFWNGTNWLSSQLHTFQFDSYQDLSNAVVGGNRALFASVPWKGRYGIFVETFHSKMLKTTSKVWHIGWTNSGGAASDSLLTAHAYDGAINVHYQQISDIKAIVPADTLSIALSLDIENYGVYDAWYTYRLVG